MEAFGYCYGDGRIRNALQRAYCDSHTIGSISEDVWRVGSKIASGLTLGSHRTSKQALFPVALSKRHFLPIWVCGVPLLACSNQVMSCQIAKGLPIRYFPAFTLTQYTDLLSSNDFDQ